MKTATLANTTPTLFEKIASAWAWTAAVLCVLIGFPVVTLVFLLTAPFDPGRYAAGYAFRGLARVHTWLNPLWSFHASGYHVTDPRRPYVAIANHESYADIFLLSHLPWEMKWLSKDTIFRIPVMGWMMRMAGDVPVRRGERDSVVAALAACRERLARRVSVMIFPEGTRSREGMMLPFKNGAFNLAVETGTPILPIVVAGTRYAMAKGSFRFQRAYAIAKVLEPIETRGLTQADVPALRDRARTLLQQARDALEQELQVARARA